MYQTDKKKVKNTFNLKGINPTQVERKFCINIAENNDTSTITIPQNTTPLTQLLESNKTSLYLDDNRKYHITMLDSMSKNELQTGMRCYWDHHVFDTLPLGCPLRFHHDKLVRTCKSDITNEQYIIQQNISQRTSTEYTETLNEVIVPSNYYETEGNFCSFNCILAYIHTNRTNPTYTQSKYLTMRMYKELFEDKDIHIEKAHDWRCLKEYGGWMTIEEFRRTFANYTFENTGRKMMSLPYKRPIGYIFEETYNF